MSSYFTWQQGKYSVSVPLYLVAGEVQCLSTPLYLVAGEVQCPQGKYSVFPLYLAAGEVQCPHTLLGIRGSTVSFHFTW